MVDLYILINLNTVNFILTVKLNVCIFNIRTDEVKTVTLRLVY